MVWAAGSEASDVTSRPRGWAPQSRGVPFLWVVPSRVRAPAPHPTGVPHRHQLPPILVCGAFRVSRL